LLPVLWWKMPIPMNFCLNDFERSGVIMKLALEHVSKSYRVEGNAVAVLQDISLGVAPGEFISLLGPSGCGKSTALSILAGLIKPDSGQVLCPGKVSHMPQRDLLLPWRTLLDNVALPLELAGQSKENARASALSWLPEFGLDGFASCWPRQLSGGMRQRAALLRTFLHGGEFLLLDEPFGQLDAMTKGNLQQWLAQEWEKWQRGVLFVTHDIDEAILLSDKVYVMSSRPGQILGEVEIQLPRPRHRRQQNEQAFLAAKNQVWNLLSL